MLSNFSLFFSRLKSWGATLFSQGAPDTPPPQRFRPPLMPASFSPGHVRWERTRLRQAQVRLIEYPRGRVSLAGPIESASYSHDMFRHLGMTPKWIVQHADMTICRPTHEDWQFLWFMVAQVLYGEAEPTLTQAQYGRDRVKREVLKSAQVPLFYLEQNGRPQMRNYALTLANMVLAAELVRNPRSGR